MARTQLRAVASGHLHRLHRQVRGTLVEQWAPSTAFVTPDTEHSKGDATLGVLCWDLDDDLKVSCEAPPGLEGREADAIPEMVAYLGWLEQPARP